MESQKAAKVVSKKNAKKMFKKNNLKNQENTNLIFPIIGAHFGILQRNSGRNSFIH